MIIGKEGTNKYVRVPLLFKIPDFVLTNQILHFNSIKRS